MFPGVGFLSGFRIVEVFVLIVIVLWIAWLTRTRRMGPSGWRGDDRPRAGALDDSLEILRKRYARGEIDEAEFERKRRFLDGG